jgi:hypothetical protein
MFHGLENYGNIKLVCGFKHFFHSTWDNPSDWLSYFSRWLKPPTRKDLMSLMILYNVCEMIIPWFLDMCFTVVNMEGREQHRIDGIKDWVAMDPWFGNF